MKQSWPPAPIENVREAIQGRAQRPEGAELGETYGGAGDGQ